MMMKDNIPCDEIALSLTTEPVLLGFNEDTSHNYVDAVQLACKMVSNYKKAGAKRYMEITNEPLVTKQSCVDNVKSIEFPMLGGLESSSNDIETELTFPTGKLKIVLPISDAAELMAELSVKLTEFQVLTKQLIEKYKKAESIADILNSLEICLGYT